MKQGRLDGLCGLYSLLNFMAARSDADDENIFRYLLEAAGSFNLLNAHYLCDGYEAHLLVRIFNQVCADHLLPFRAVPLLAVSRHLQANNFSSIARAIFSPEEGDPGEIVMSIDGGKHWVLAYGLTDSHYIVDDSDPTNTGRLLARKGRAIPTNDGVVILPMNSKLAANSNA